jgi:transposase-like protein
MDKNKIIIRQRRIFSVELKKEIVKDIEKGKASVLQTSREYSVSANSVYKWIEKYSQNLHRGTILVMQKKSEANGKQELLLQIKDLEAALGRKQMEIEIKDKIIEFASEEFNVDIKKKYFTKLSNGSAMKNKND